VGYVKALVSVTPLPLNLEVMKEYIAAALSTLDGDATKGMG
jgi:hypothetical protein